MHKPLIHRNADPVKLTPSTIELASRRILHGSVMMDRHYLQQKSTGDCLKGTGDCLKITGDCLCDTDLDGRGWLGRPAPANVVVSVEADILHGWEREGADPLTPLRHSTPGQTQSTGSNIKHNI